MKNIISKGGRERENFVFDDFLKSTFGAYIAACGSIHFIKEKKSLNDFYVIIFCI